MTTTPHILITGANGFIGKPLCRLLVDKGFRVTGTIRSLEADHVSTPGLHLYETGDLESFEDWPELMTGVDAVVHLAARVHVMGEGGAEVLDSYRQANVAVTKRLLRAAAAAGVRRFVFLSSVKAIGEGGGAAYTENTLPEPTDPYGISKLEAEQAVQAVGKETGIETVIFRLPLVYGPYVRANFLRLMKLVDRGYPLPLASVRNGRSMIYIGNLVDALQVCLQHEQAAGETFMVSDGQDFSTPGLIRSIAGAMGRKVRLLACPPMLLKLTGTMVGKGQVVQRLLGSLSVDSSKIRSQLDWAPPFTTNDGIAETVAWYLNSKE